MQKRYAAGIAALVLLAGTVLPCFAAKGEKCTVESVADDGKVSMVCKEAGKFKAGDEIKLTPSKKGLKCTVASIADDGKVSMTCKEAEQFKAGDTIKLTPPKKKMISTEDIGGGC